MKVVGLQQQVSDILSFLKFAVDKCTYTNNKKYVKNMTIEFENRKITIIIFLAYKIKYLYKLTNATGKSVCGKYYLCQANQSCNDF